MYLTDNQIVSSWHSHWTVYVDKYLSNSTFKQMRSLIIIALFLIGFVSQAQTQHDQQSSKETRTIEINNDKGDFHLSYINGELQTLEVNGEVIPEEQYSNYQKLIDDCSSEIATPEPPQVPTPPASVELDDKSAMLYTKITDHLANQEIINTEKKFKIQLKKDYLKVGGKKLGADNHDICLELFEEIYGHALNENSEVKFKKGKRNSSSSIRISN